MQVWTMASGNTAVIASGKPFRPSTTAISTSSTPRLLSSVMTRSQNFAPSVCSIHSPRISLVPSARTEHHVDGLVADSNQLGIEAGLAVAGDLQLQLAG